MYKCERCGKTSVAGEKCHIVATDTRKKIYRENGIIVGRGVETVKEEKLCKDCAKGAKK